MHILRNLCCIAALLVCAPPTLASRAPQPILITLDGHHYVTYAAPLVLSPLERLVQAPEARMLNCRRSNGEAFAPGAFRLVYSIEGTSLDATSMRVVFAPTRVVLETLHKDVICEGEANGGETGLDRLFRGDFEPDD